MNTPLIPTETYIDSSIYEQTFVSLSLSLQLSLNELSFCIKDKVQDKCLAILNYAFIEKLTISGLLDVLQKLFIQQSLLQKEFSQVNVSYKNNTVKLLPKALFDVNQLPAYFSLTQEDTTDQIILHDFINEIEACSIYLLAKSIEKLIKKKFANAKFFHNSSCFIKAVFNNKIIENQKDMAFVNIMNNEFELIIFKKSVFQMYNSFRFKVKEDFIYYLLFALKQFNCDPGLTKLIVMGKIAEKSSIHQLLIKYIADVSFLPNTSLLNENTVLGEMPDYYYFTLLNLSKCE
ncbi:MAG: DUF3822 family protein [Bacteroidota bacterium]